MKKYLIILLLCCCLVLAGCDYGGVALVQNSNGSVEEYYFIPYDEQLLVSAGVSINVSRGEILPRIKQDCDLFFVNLLNEYQSRIGANQNYTLNERAELVAGVTIQSNLPSNLFLVNDLYKEIKYEISFANSLCYNEFKNINQSIKEEREVVEINNFFTTTKRVVKDPIFDKMANESITIGKKCLELANNIMEQEIGALLWEEIKQEINYQTYASKFEYTYVVPTARIHTNASTVQKSSEGYYYHTWQIDLNNIELEQPIKIEYWTTSANRPVWYVLALLVAGGIIATTLVISKNKEKQEQARFKIEK